MDQNFYSKLHPCEYNALTTNKVAIILLGEVKEVDKYDVVVKYKNRILMIMDVFVLVYDQM